MSPMVSMIVPVYNAEKTLRRCLESILTQQYSDFEVLLMDDGSTDAAGTICDEYAAKDSRIQVIHKTNSGVSDTRNLALELAKGVYIQFLDSDDWITPDATNSLVRAAETHQCDLVIADFYRVVGKRLSHKGDIREDKVLSREEFAGHMMNAPADFYYGVLWNKLYRREIIAQHHLRMAPDISWCEDFMFNLEYIRYAERFYALQLPIYYYVKTKGSLVAQSATFSNTIKMKLTVFEYYQQFFKSVLDDDEYEKVRGKVYRFLLDAAGDGMVPPLPSTQKLGEERVQIVSSALHGTGCLCDAYRDRKLLESYLETAALKNDLSLQDTILLLALRQLKGSFSRRELADFVKISRSNLTIGLQRLVSRDLIQIEKLHAAPEKQLLVSFTPAAVSVLGDLDIALIDYERARCSGFSQEEQYQYQALTQTAQSTIQKILQS